MAKNKWRVDLLTDELRQARSWLNSQHHALDARILSRAHARATPTSVGNITAGLVGRNASDGAQQYIDSMLMRVRALILRSARISDATGNEMRRLFSAWDTSQSGRINKAELWSVLEDAGFSAGEAEVQAVLDAIDGDGDNLISYGDFIAFAGLWGAPAPDGDSGVEGGVRARSADYAHLDLASPEFAQLETGRNNRRWNHPSAYAYRDVDKSMGSEVPQLRNRGWARRRDAGSAATATWSRRRRSSCYVDEMAGDLRAIIRRAARHSDMPVHACVPQARRCRFVCVCARVSAFPLLLLLCRYRSS